MNRVSPTPHEYAKYADAQDEIDVPEYFNLPNLIKVSDFLDVTLKITIPKPITPKTFKSIWNGNRMYDSEYFSPGFS